RPCRAWRGTWWTDGPRRSWQETSRSCGTFPCVGGVLDGDEHAEPFAGEVGVAFIEVEEDGVAAESVGDESGGAAAAERVEDDAGSPAGAGVVAVEAAAVGAGAAAGRPAGGGR